MPVCHVFLLTNIIAAFHSLSSIVIAVDLGKCCSKKFVPLTPTEGDTAFRSDEHKINSTNLRVAKELLA